MHSTHLVLSRRRGRRAGFTLVEVLISAALSSVIMAGVLTAFLLIGRTSYNAASYSIMETEARRALETFGQEARMASNIQWNSSTSITLTVARLTGYQVTYAYDSSTSGATAQAFYRQVSGGNPEILVNGVSDFSFRRYKVVNGADFAATNDLETKQIQITLRAVRSRATTVDATNAVLSARVILRNKQVST